jgi:hypothetical protein
MRSFVIRLHLEMNPHMTGNIQELVSSFVRSFNGTDDERIVGIQQFTRFVAQLDPTETVYFKLLIPTLLQSMETMQNGVNTCLEDLQTLIMFSPAFFTENTNTIMTSMLTAPITLRKMGVVLMLSDKLETECLRDASFHVPQRILHGPLFVIKNFSNDSDFQELKTLIANDENTNRISCAATATCCDALFEKYLDEIMPTMRGEHRYSIDYLKSRAIFNATLITILATQATTGITVDEISEKATSQNMYTNIYQAWKDTIQSQGNEFVRHTSHVLPLFLLVASYEPLPQAMNKQGVLRTDEKSVSEKGNICNMLGQIVTMIDPSRAIFLRQLEDLVVTVARAFNKYPEIVNGIVELKNRLEVEERTCTACRKVSETKLAKCKGCRCARYCNAECQKMAWNQHKSKCKQWGRSVT